LDDVRAAATWPPPPADLNTLFAAGDFSDILVAAQDADLAVIDANAGLLPLVRHQERLRHTLPLQRAQFALWLERGLCTGEPALRDISGARPSMDWQPALAK
jgi:hypothetical protein